LSAGFTVHDQHTRRHLMSAGICFRGNISKNKGFLRRLEVFNTLSWRAHYVAMIWTRAGEPWPHLPPATDHGWTEIEGALCPVLSLKLPSPKSILLLIRCICQNGCSSNRCSCTHANLPCMELYRCHEHLSVCINFSFGLEWWLST